MNPNCEYNGCDQDAMWVIECPVAWSQYACDDHLGPTMLDYKETVILYEINPVGANPRIYQFAMPA